MELVGELASVRSLPIFSWLAPAATLSDKAIYTTLVRGYGPINEMSMTFIVMYK